MLDHSIPAVISISRCRCWTVSACWRGCAIHVWRGCGIPVIMISGDEQKGKGSAARALSVSRFHRQGHRCCCLELQARVESADSADPRAARGGKNRDQQVLGYGQRVVYPQEVHQAAGSTGLVACVTTRQRGQCHGAPDSTVSTPCAREAGERTGQAVAAAFCAAGGREGSQGDSLRHFGNAFAINCRQELPEISARAFGNRLRGRSKWRTSPRMVSV